MVGLLESEKYRMYSHGPGKGGEIFVCSPYHPGSITFHLPAEKMNSGRSAAPSTKYQERLATNYPCRLATAHLEDGAF